MPRPKPSALARWRRLADDIERALAGLPDEALELRGGEDGLSIREAVHHLLEANLVASTIMIAALGKSGATYDWSWLWPDAAWCRRVGYTTTPIGPALAALRALGEHMAGVLAATPDALRRHVKLLDAPGATPYKKTVEEILRQEVDHAREHLQALAQTRAAHGV